MDRDNYYTVPETAKILDISQARVRQLLRAGEIEGERTGSVWKLPKHAVHSFRDSYEPKGKQKDSESLSAETRDALEKVETLQRELGRMEGRLELEAVARSTIDAQLERERQRADQERQERLQAQAEARRLAAELEEARKSWWQKLFGR